MPNFKLVSNVVCLSFVILSWISCSLATFGAPTLLFSYAGPCYNSWCDTGWYSSPLVTTDVNGNPMIVGGGYNLYAVNGSGSTIWSVSYSSRLWADIAEADIDNNGVKEIITTNGAIVGVHNKDGSSFPNFPQTLTSELRSLTVSDLDQSGKYEIIVGLALSQAQNVWVLNYDGSIRTGWPQATSTADGYSAGVYNTNTGTSDLDGDGLLEVIVPSDMFYICAYHHDGTPVSVPSGIWASATVWGQVGFYQDIAYELQGYGPCASTDPLTPRTNFADGPVSSADMDGDGSVEYVVTGNTYYCNSASEPPAYNGVFIVNGNRTRWSNPTLGYNWINVPSSSNSPLGPPINPMGDYSTIQDVQFNPTLADIDGDGYLEILYASYDGKVHCFWLDKTEKYNWPYVVGTNSTLTNVAYASEVVVADFDNNGQAEIVFGTIPVMNNGIWGDLIVLNSHGQLLYKISLPVSKACAFSSSQCSTSWNGILGAPTIANIDSTPDYEIVAMTANSGLIAFTVPYSSNTRLIWPTGRGNYFRDGNAQKQNLAPLHTTGVSNVNSSQVVVPSHWLFFFSFILLSVLPFVYHA